MYVEINIPDKIATYYGKTPKEVSNYMLQVAVLECLRRRIITTKEVGDILNLDREEIYQLVDDHEIPIYTLSDLQKDRKK